MIDVTNGEVSTREGLVIEIAIIHLINLKQQNFIMDKMELE